MFVLWSCLEGQEIWPGSACSQTVSYLIALKQSLDVETKDSDTSRGLGDLFVRHCFRWKVIHDTKFESSRNRAKRGLEFLAEPDDDEFAVDIPRDPQSVTLIR